MFAAALVFANPLKTVFAKVDILETIVKFLIVLQYSQMRPQFAQIMEAASLITTPARAFQVTREKNVNTQFASAFPQMKHQPCVQEKALVQHLIFALVRMGLRMKSARHRSVSASLQMKQRFALQAERAQAQTTALAKTDSLTTNVNTQCVTILHQTRL